MTFGDFIAEVRGHLRAANKDDYIPARYIISVGISRIQYLINSRPNSSTYRSLNVFTWLPCLEMKRIKSIDCPISEFRICDKIMRSKKKLPKIFTGRQGFIIEGLLNPTNSQEYHQLRSPKDYLLTKSRQFGNNFKYYFIQDEYLYLLNTTVELVNINGLFMEEDEVRKASSVKNDKPCASKLDNKFIAPDEFVSTVIDQTVQLLLGGRMNRVEDENPDMSSNQKTRTE